MMIVKFGLYKINLTELTDKVTENFTGKELDDETELGYWGARYLDLMLGLWISVDPKRQFSSPYLYAGNGFNPVNVIDEDGDEVKGTFSKSTGILTLRDNDSGKEVSGKYFTGGIAGAPIPNGTYEILEQAQREGFYRLDLVDANPRNDVAELPDGSTRDRFRLHGQGMSLGCVTACEGTDHSKIDKFLQNTKTSVVKDNYDAPWYVNLKKFFFGSDNESNINKYGKLDVTD
jgi:RHS repeat-associated protein